MADNVEIVEAVRVLRYVGRREAVERTLENSIQGTMHMGHGKGWHPDSPVGLTVHAEELGRPRVIDIQLGYEDAYQELHRAANAQHIAPPNMIDNILNALTEAGVGLVRKV